MKSQLFKYILILGLCAGAITVFAQQTTSFIITGKVTRKSTITLDSLRQYAVINIGSVNVTNHKGDFKHKDDKLKGVLLKDILSHTQFDVSNPKLLSEIYIICIASDGYKVVYSWNELYNTRIGNSVYILTEKNGIKADAMPEGIQMLSALDEKMGRRYLHNLSKIVIARAE